MEQRLERALITTMFFGFVAVAAFAGFVTAIECGIATACCYLATGWVQRQASARRFTAGSSGRVSIRGDGPRGSQRRKAAHRRPTRFPSSPTGTPDLDRALRAGESTSEDSYGW